MTSNQSSITSLDDSLEKRHSIDSSIASRNHFLSINSEQSDDNDDVVFTDSNTFTFDFIAQKEKQFKLLNDQINAETKHVLQEASEIVKNHEKKLREDTEKELSSSRSGRLKSKAMSAAIYIPSSDNSAAQQTVKSIIEQNKNIPDTELDIAAQQMGPEAVIKFYKARTKALEMQLNELTLKYKESEEKVKSLESKEKEASVEGKNLQKQLTQVQLKFDKQKREFDALKDKYKSSLETVNEMEKELVFLRREQGKEKSKANPADPKAKDLQLKRALEEVEKYKAQLDQLQTEKGQAEDNIRRECEKYKQESKKLERQKQDLIVAFKKQMKLIDILKRQKVHLEAAKLLSISEKEFSNCLNWK